MNVFLIEVIPREVRQAKTAFTRITPKEALGGTNASDIFEVYSSIMPFALYSHNFTSITG